MRSLVGSPSAEEFPSSETIAECISSVLTVSSMWLRAEFCLGGGAVWGDLLGSEGSPAHQWRYLVSSWQMPMSEVRRSPSAVLSDLMVVELCGLLASVWSSLGFLSAAVSDMRHPTPSLGILDLLNFLFLIHGSRSS